MIERIETGDSYADLAYAAGDDDRFIFPQLHRRTELCALFRFWQAKRAGRGGLLPARSAVAVEELRPWLGWINLIEVVEGGRDYVFRLYGSNVVQEAGHDLTGKSISVLPAVHWPVVRGPFARVVAEARPCCTRHVMRDENRSIAWERLVLPLAEDGHSVDMLLVGLYRVRLPSEP